MTTTPLTSQTEPVDPAETSEQRLGRVPDHPDTPGHPSVVEEAVARLKPRLRGWLHFSAAPLALVLGLILMVLTEEQDLRAALAVYLCSTVLLFGVSAAYHLGAGRPPVNRFLRRLDHANIYLFIAGSYTPFAVALPDRTTGITILVLVWTIALVGLLLPILWLHAPRWLVAGSYIALGWVAIFYLPTLYSAFGAGVVALLGLGGVLYTAGGVIYALKRPDPSPEWFGFHELFHALTIAAYLVQYVAVALVVLG